MKRQSSYWRNTEFHSKEGKFVVVLLGVPSAESALALHGTPAHSGVKTAPDKRFLWVPYSLY